MAAAARTPFEATRRVFVIEAVDTMTEEAANRMLKTLEEPPAFVHLLLLTDRREDVLETIASRCQAVRFDPLAPALVAERLEALGTEGRRRWRARDWPWVTPASRSVWRARRAGRCAQARRASSAPPWTVRTEARPWTALLDAAKASGERAGAQRGGAARGPPRARSGEGAQTRGARGAGGSPPRRAPRAHAHARAGAAPGGAVAEGPAAASRRRSAAELISCGRRAGDSRGRVRSKARHARARGRARVSRSRVSPHGDGAHHGHPSEPRAERLGGAGAGGPGLQAGDRAEVRLSP